MKSRIANPDRMTPRVTLNLSSVKKEPDLGFPFLLSPELFFLAIVIVTFYGLLKYNST
jgi:hypothetical protein